MEIVQSAVHEFASTEKNILRCNQYVGDTPRNLEYRKLERVLFQDDVSVGSVVVEL